MSTVTVRFVDGPAGGSEHELPADPAGTPPARWVLSEHQSAPGDHLYENAGRDGRGTWTMRFVRTDPVGMTE